MSDGDASDTNSNTLSDIIRAALEDEEAKEENDIFDTILSGTDEILTNSNKAPPKRKLQSKSVSTLSLFSGVVNVEEADDANQFTDIINAPISEEETEGDEDSMIDTLLSGADEIKGNEKAEQKDWLKADTFNSSTISLFNLAISEEYNEVDEIYEEANEVDDSGATVSNEDTKADDGTTVDTILTGEDNDSNFSVGRTDINDNAKTNVPKNEQVVSMGSKSVETKNRENNSNAKELNQESKLIVSALLRSSLENLGELLKEPCMEDIETEKKTLMQRNNKNMTGWNYKQAAETMVQNMIESSTDKLEKVFQSDKSNWKHRPVDT